MKRTDFFQAIGLSADQSNQVGWAQWSSPAAASKGLRAAANVDPYAITLKVDIWGIDGSPGAPLDAIFEIQGDNVALVNGSVVGQTASLDDIVREFARYAAQTQSKPVMEMRDAPAPVRAGLGR